MESYATAQQVYAAGLIFARLSALMMLIPGIGEVAVPPRVRLAFALSMALLLFPLVGGTIPPIPAAVSGVASAVIKEVLIGLLIGAILRMFMGALAVAGEVVSLQTTLSFSQTANPREAQPSTSLATFLGLFGLVLVLATNLHHLFLSAIVRSYSVFPFGQDVQVGDSVALAVQTVGRSFALGLQMAAPVVVFALIFNIATGLVGRVMPQFQIFFVATPLLVLMGLSVFALSIGVIGMVWIERYRDLISVFG